MKAAVDVRQISKSFKGLQALKEATLEVRPSEIFGLVGPDGAGKTTLFRILVSLLLPDGGSATILGHDTQKDYKMIRRITGYMPGRFSLYHDLTVSENLSFFASIFGTTVRENYHLIRDIYGPLEPFAHRQAGKLSGGMKQKLALSCALIHNPSLLVLDEPTTGVDAVSRKEFWEMLAVRRAEGITILVSTPYMDEAALCDRVALIQNGRIMGIDHPDGLVKAFPWPLYAVASEMMYPLPGHLKEFHLTRSAYRFGDRIHLALREDDPESVESFLRSKGHTKISLSSCKPGIEDCFMELMVNGQH
ncbi:MAG: ABC transporter ATP-binding protein [Bacteroidales bacterium]|nr:ABC transporter ATP-binding protein [Bacteroidales bacterium]